MRCWKIVKIKRPDLEILYISSWIFKFFRVTHNFYLLYFISSIALDCVMPPFQDQLNN